jgi:RHS repeat-associated protein
MIGIFNRITRYRYDGHNHLFGVTNSGQSETLRFYQNERLSNTVQDGRHTQYLYNQEQPLGQQQPGDARQTLLLLTDSKHSVIGESQQSDLRTSVYNAYGERSSVSSMQSLLAFNGEVRDEASGWYLLGRGYRAYNPSLMRFHSPDSLSPFGAGGVNPYMYCAGDPINFRDPTGHFFSGGDGGWDLVFFGVLDIVLSFGNPLSIIGGAGAIVAGFGVMSNSATPSEKQFNQQLGTAFGFLGMASLLAGKGAKKAVEASTELVSPGVGTFSDKTISALMQPFDKLPRPQVSQLSPERLQPLHKLPRPQVSQLSSELLQPFDELPRAYVDLFSKETTKALRQQLDNLPRVPMAQNWTLKSRKSWSNGISSPDNPESIRRLSN